MFSGFRIQAETKESWRWRWEMKRNLNTKPRFEIRRVKHTSIQPFFNAFNPNSKKSVWPSNLKMRWSPRPPSSILSYTAIRLHFLGPITFGWGTFVPSKHKRCRHRPCTDGLTDSVNNRELFFYVLTNWTQSQMFKAIETQENWVSFTNRSLLIYFCEDLLSVLIGAFTKITFFTVFTFQKKICTFFS